MNRDLLQRLISARERRAAVAVVTSLASGQQRLVERNLMADDPLIAALTEGFRFDRSGVAKTEEGEFFIHIHNPPLKLISIGAVHIAQTLIQFAKELGYDVTVIDPRGAFATEERFPGVTLHADWPDEVLPGIALDARTAMVALTHDPKIDDRALTAALSSECFYIGALGSKRTHATRIERLEAAGISRNSLARIHAPIGIDIGARGPAEISVSIMAEMTQALRLGK